MMPGLLWPKRRGMTTQQSSRRQKLVVVASNLVVVALGLGTSVISSRHLNPAGRGQLVSWQSWATTLTTLSALGYPQLLVTDKLLPRRLGLRDIRWEVSGVSCIAILVAIWATALLGGPPIALVGAACMALSGMLNALQIALAQRSGAMGLEFNLLRLAPPIAGLAACVVLLGISRSGPSVWFTCIGVAQLVAVLTCWLWLRMPRVNVCGARRRWLSTLALLPISWITLLQYRADLLLVTLLFPKDIVAFYSIGTAAQSAAFAAGQSGGMLWFGRQRNGSVRSALLSTAATSASVSALVILTSWILVPTIYGQSFAPAIPVVIVLSGISVPLSMDYLLTHIAMKDGTHQRTLLVKASGLLLLTLSMLGAQRVSHTAVTAAIVAMLATVVTLCGTAMVVAIGRRRARVHDSERFA